MNKHYLKEYVLLFEFLIPFFGSTTGFVIFSLFVYSTKIFVLKDLLGDVNVFGECSTSFFIRFQIDAGFFIVWELFYVGRIIIHILEVEVN